MALRPICAYPEAVLSQKAKEVDTIDDALQKLIDDMIQTMYAAPGVGLAAPQVGLSLRLFVIDVTGGRDTKGLQTFINPEMISTEGRVREDEGCLSVVGVTGQTTRAERAVLRGLNRDGESVEVEAEGLLARAFQHELDHLNGMLFFDRMGVVGRDLIKRKYLRAQRREPRR